VWVGGSVREVRVGEREARTREWGIGCCGLGLFELL